MEDQAEGLRRLADARAGRIREGICVFCGDPTPAKVDDLPVCLRCANFMEHFRSKERGGDPANT